MRPWGSGVIGREGDYCIGDDSDHHGEFEV